LLLRTFRLPGVTSANLAALLQFSAVLPVLFFVTLYLQEVQRYSLQEVQRHSALRAGLAFLPLAAGVGPSYSGQPCRSPNGWSAASRLVVLVLTHIRYRQVAQCR
jgi:hypothetical protein